MTLGSLFDGAAGFPYAGKLAGIKPVWASEIEPFPIRVTTKQIPEMKHYGNITEIDGSSIEAVDIITFGSPCQDLSIAGKREGLAGARSGLFREAIRIIREMRENTNGQKPRYIVWENVPGAFSSNGGEDFRTVLEEIAKIKDRGAAIPQPNKGKWQSSGEILGDGYSIAWRTYDAQFWGVPQRRKRIYLVADFGGQRAGKIQFESDRLCRDFAQGKGEGQGIAGTFESDPGTPSEPTYVLNDQGGRQIDATEDVTGTLRTEAHGHPPIVIAPTVYGLSSKDSNAWKSSNPRNGCYEAKATRTLGTRGGDPTCAQGGNIVVAPRAYESHNQDSRYKELKGKSETVVARYGTGGGNAPIVIEPKAYATGNGLANTTGELETVVAPLDCMHDQKITLAPAPENEYPYIARRLTPTECARLQGFPDWWCDGLASENPSDEEVTEWMGIFETHRKAIGKATKPKTANQVRKWLKNPYSDSAAYKMWGNSLAVPNAYQVLAGIAEEDTELAGAKF